MSGTSSDTQVSVSFGGTTGEFEAACQRAQQALAALTTGVTSFTSGLSATTAAVNATTPAVTAMSAATTTAAASMQRISPAARSAAQDMQALVNATTGISRESRSAADSAEIFRSALGDQSNEVKALRSSFDGVSTAATGTGHAAGGVTRELLVLGHEAMMGNFSRFGGSLMVMAELIGGISVGMLAAGGLIAVAGIAAYHLYENFKVASQQAEELNANMVLMGRDPVAAAAAAKQLADQLHATGEIGSTAARDIADAFIKIPLITNDMALKLGMMVPALHAAMSTGPVNEFGVSMAKAQSTVQGIEHQMKDFNLLTTSAQRDQMAGYVDTNNLLGAQILLYDRLKERLVEQSDVRAAATKEAKDAAFAQSLASGMSSLDGGMPDMGPPPKPPAPLKMTEQAESPEDQKLDEAETRLNAGKRQEIELTQTIIGLTARLAAETDEGDKKRTQSALDVALAERAAMKDKGDTSWVQKQEAALSAQNLAITKSAATVQAATQAKLDNEVNYWTKVLAGTTLSVQQRAEAEQQLTRAQQSQAENGLRIKDAASRATVTTTKKTVEEEVSALSAQQAANRDDFTKWQAIEQQKLALLRAAYGEKSKAFQDELKAEETYAREHAAKLEAMELERIDRENAVGQKGLSERIAQLQTEVGQSKLTKADELDASRQATSDEQTLELNHLDTFIASLTKGTDEFKKAMQQREMLYQTFQTRLAGIDTQIADNEKRVSDRATADYTSAFNRIGSEGQRMATGLIMGTTTWQKAEQQATQTVLQSVVQLTTQALARWAAKELFQTATTKAGIAARDQLENGDATGTVIAKYLASWLGLETGKTTATAAQNAIRTTSDATAATTAATTGSLGAMATIKADAAAAGAGAYAATAMIPYVGPALAPAAAASAYAGALSFSAAALPSFAVGAWNLPNDMIAQVHAGEMIVPAQQAAQIRAGGGGGSSGGGGGIANFNISAVDGASVMVLLRANMPQIARSLQQHWQTSPSTRP